MRLALLLDTLGGAVSGLRRELALGGGGPRPADLVAGAQSARGGGAVDDRRRPLTRCSRCRRRTWSSTATTSPRPATRSCRWPTSAPGWWASSAALAARTGVEITVVFDGAGRGRRADPRLARGVRVLFSDAGVLADDVIRELVAAEPRGRPVVVATSDRAVVTSVCRSGAHTVPSRGAAAAARRS